VTPDRTRRLRRATAILAVVWAILSLALAIWGQARGGRGADPPIHTGLFGSVAIVRSVSAQAAAAGVRPGDRVLSVDGVPIERWYHQRGWERIRPDRAVRYRIQHPRGEVRELSLPAAPSSTLYQRLLIPIFAALVGVGLTFLLLGIFVWRLKPGRAESWAFLLFSSAAATVLFSAVHTYDAPAGYERLVMNLPLLGATLFHLFTVFPSEPAWVARHRRIRGLPYAITAAIAGLVAVERWTGLPMPFLSPLGIALSLGLGGISIGVLILERRRMRGTGASRAADIVLAGALVSSVPVLLLLGVQLAFPVSFPTSATMIWFVVFPIAIAVGIVRGELFYARGLTRSSVAYGAATLAITGLFAFLITFADALFGRFQVNATSPGFSVVFLFFAVLAFNPLRDRLQSLVDRVFDRDRAGYRSAVREISEALVSMLSLDEISQRLLAAVTEPMGVERAAVLLLSEDGQRLRPLAWRGDFEEDVGRFELPVDHPIAKQLWMRRQELSRRDFDESTDAESRELCWDVFDSLDVKLLVPILFGVDLLGVIAVGGKLSGEGLGADDRQLLRTLANQSAIAIENAQAFDEIAKLNAILEARVEERTRELQATQAQLLQSEKLRSLGQLVAGVAHELNNPIGFVHANLQLLEDYVARLLAAQAAGDDVETPREAIRKLLARSREGTDRVKKIVLDLRTFSRMDQADLSDVDLNEEIERTLALMEARFKDGITVRRDLQQIPRVRCYPAQLNQVFMNLVMNACDALDGQGTIQVETRPCEMGVRLAFRDSGPGIPPALRERIFEPFFTTKPVGQGTGLGLSISHGIVERHGGRMSVECPEEGGSVFRIELPLTTPPASEAPSSH